MEFLGSSIWGFEVCVYVCVNLCLFECRYVYYGINVCVYMYICMCVCECLIHYAVDNCLENSSMLQVKVRSYWKSTGYQT